MATTRYGDRFFFNGVRMDAEADGDLQIYSVSGGGLFQLSGGVLTHKAAAFGHMGAIVALSDGGTLGYGQLFESGDAYFHVRNADGTFRISSGSVQTGALPDGPDADANPDNASLAGPTATALVDGGFHMAFTDRTYGGENVPITYGAIAAYPNPPGGYYQSTATSTVPRGPDVSHRVYEANGSAGAPLTVDNTESYSSGYVATSRTAGQQYAYDTVTLSNGAVVQGSLEQVYRENFTPFNGGAFSDGTHVSWEMSARILTEAGGSTLVRLNTDVYNDDIFDPVNYRVNGTGGLELVSLGSAGFAAIWTEISYVADASAFGGWTFQGSDTVIRYFDGSGAALTDEIRILHRDASTGNMTKHVAADALADGRIAVTFVTGSDGANGSAASAGFILTVGQLGSSLSSTVITQNGLRAGQVPGEDFDLESIGGNNVAVTYYDAYHDAINAGPQPSTVVETYSITGPTGTVQFGTDGSETLAGNSYGDMLHGYSGNDSLFGGAGIDYLEGGRGQDTLNGGTGADMMLGGFGNDTYYVDNANDTIQEDTFGYGPTQDTDTVYANVSWSAEYWSLVEVIYANAGSKGLRLSSEYFTTLIGGVGNDTLDSGFAGATTTMIGGAGNDTFIVTSSGDVVTESAGGGADTLYARTGFTLAAASEVEKIIADAGGTGLAITGSDTRNTITGGIGNDTLSGAGGIDSLVGGAGADSLLGGAGADTLVGGTGVDTMDGGEDGDSYTVDQTDTVFDSGSTGIDRVTTNTNFTLSTGNGIEYLATTYAGAGVATLVGNEGDNRVTGGTSRDVLKGGAGEDTLFGNGNADTLEGGAGRDNMTGGDGADTFRFAAGDAGATATTFEVVNDFVTGVDTIDLAIFSGPPIPAAYAETATATWSFGVLLAAGNAALDGTVRAAFVAGSVDGWLFWDENADGSADGALRLVGLNSLAAFDRADLI